MKPGIYATKKAIAPTTMANGENDPIQSFFGKHDSGWEVFRLNIPWHAVPPHRDLNLFRALSVLSLSIFFASSIRLRSSSRAVLAFFVFPGSADFTKSSVK